MVKPSQENDFFCTVNEIFFRDACSFPYIKTLLKVSDPVFEKKSRVNNFKDFDSCFDNTCHYTPKVCCYTTSAFKVGLQVTIEEK